LCRFESVALFQLQAEDSKLKHLGRSYRNANTNSLNNELGFWKHLEFDVVIFDLSHVNEALIQHKSKPVHGIGADVLLMKGGSDCRLL
jgi:hypothetical protein